VNDQDGVWWLNNNYKYIYASIFLCLILEGVDFLDKTAEDGWKGNRNLKKLKVVKHLCVHELIWRKESQLVKSNLNTNAIL